MHTVQQRPPAFRVCAKCARRSHQMALLAADEIYGLCSRCFENLRAADADPLAYLQSRLPRVQNHKAAPMESRVLPWPLPRPRQPEDRTTEGLDSRVEGAGA
jgi:hypothetical protein